MASKQEFVDYVCDQCALAGSVWSRKMFGEYGLYCDGKYFSLVCDDQFLVKITEPGKTLMPDCPQAIPYEGAGPMFFIENLDDKDFLAELVQVTCAALPEPKPRKKKEARS